jgi:hypothetical protein
VTHKGSKPKESIFPAHVEHSSVDGNGGGDSSSAAADVDGRGNILERTSKRQRRNWKKDEPKEYRRMCKTNRVKLANAQK